jgi:TolB-like protein
MAPTPDEVRHQLKRLLESPGLASSGRLRRFLEFVVDKTLTGEGERLKEFVIGVEVFDRDAQYDPRIDSIVRVEAARLRTKLAEYYNGEGHGDAIVFTLPKGGYAPIFTPATGAPTPPRPVVPSKRAWALGVLGTFALASAVVFVGTPRTGVDAPRLRIAVLPFAPYTDDSAERVIAARITDGVTAELVRAGRLDVIASTTARQFGAAPGRLRDVAAELDADVLVQANLRTDGNRVRVEARAVNANLEQKFWVEDFAGTVDDLDALERQVAAAIDATVETFARGRP